MALLNCPMLLIESCGTIGDYNHEVECPQWRLVHNQKYHTLVWFTWFTSHFLLLNFLHCKIFSCCQLISRNNGKNAKFSLPEKKYLYWFSRSWCMGKSNSNKIIFFHDYWKKKNETEPKLCNSYLQQSRNTPARTKGISQVDVILSFQWYHRDHKIHRIMLHKFTRLHFKICNHKQELWNEDFRSCAFSFFF